jgi:hypothetical protein
MMIKQSRLLPPPRKLSEELADLHIRAGDRAVPLREVIFVLRNRAYMLLIMLLALPFIQPVPLPGLSTPLGLAIVLIALRLSLGQRPWLPMKIQRARLPAGFFGKLISFTSRLLRFLESVLRPRWPAITGRAWFNQVHAIVILVSALVLLLPLPIPLSNLLPAWAIFLLACGLLERDGLFIGLGYFAFAAGIAYFVLLGNIANEAFEHAWEWLRHRWAPA